MISNGLSHRNQHKMLGEVYVHKWKFFNRDRMGEYHSAKRKTYFEKSHMLATTFILGEYNFSS